MITDNFFDMAIIKKSGQRRRLHSTMVIDDNGGEYVVYLVVPGMERADFSISIDKSKLIVKAAKKQSLHSFFGDNKAVNLSESIDLPADADTLLTAALYRNGEVQVHIPKGITSGPVTSPMTEVYLY